MLPESPALRTAARQREGAIALRFGVRQRVLRARVVGAFLERVGGGEQGRQSQVPLLGGIVLDEGLRELAGETQRRLDERGRRDLREGPLLAAIPHVRTADAHRQRPIAGSAPERQPGSGDVEAPEHGARRLPGLEHVVGQDQQLLGHQEQVRRTELRAATPHHDGQRTADQQRVQIGALELRVSPRRRALGCDAEHPARLESEALDRSRSDLHFVLLALAARHGRPGLRERPARCRDRHRRPHGQLVHRFQHRVAQRGQGDAALVHRDIRTASGAIDGDQRVHAVPLQAELPRLVGGVELQCYPIAPAGQQVGCTPGELRQECKGLPFADPGRDVDAIHDHIEEAIERREHLGRSVFGTRANDDVNR